MPLYTNPVWTAYTPTFVGFGTVTGIECYWMRDGADVLLRLKFISGTSTAVPGTISLPNSGVVGTTVPSIAVLGYGNRNVAGADLYCLVASTTATVLTVNVSSATTHFAQAINANSIIASGDNLSCNARVPIAGWGG